MQLLRILDSSSAYEIRLTKRQAKIYFDLRIFGTFNGYVLNGEWYFAATFVVNNTLINIKNVRLPIIFL